VRRPVHQHGERMHRRLNKVAGGNARVVEIDRQQAGQQRRGVGAGDRDQAPGMAEIEPGVSAGSISAATACSGSRRGQAAQARVPAQSGRRRRQPAPARGRSHPNREAKRCSNAPTERSKLSRQPLSWITVPAAVRTAPGPARRRRRRNGPGHISVPGRNAVQAFCALPRDRRSRASSPARHRRPASRSTQRTTSPTLSARRQQRQADRTPRSAGETPPSDMASP